MLKILKVFTRVLDVIMADGEKRLKLAIENILYIAFAVACAYGAYRLIGYISESAPTLQGNCTAQGAGLIALAIIGVISCLLTGVYTLVAGVVSQAVLLVFALLGSIISRSRGKNFVSFLIALISLGVCAVVVLWLFGYLPVPA